MAFHIPYLEWFKNNGYEVHVAARNDYENKEECDIQFCDKYFDLPFERFPMKKNNVIAYKGLKRIIDANKYNIIHCHTPMGGALGRLAARNAQKKGSKVIYTAHGFHFFKGAPLINWLVYYPVERWLAKFTDVLITLNREDYGLAQNFKAKKIKYVPGVGIDVDKFKNIEINRQVKRRSIEINEDELMVISVGELNKNKNHQIIVRAVAMLKNEKIKYVLCGQGPLETELRELARQLGVEKQVKFLGYRKDIPELLYAADLFAFPSYREGLSLSLMEAMASSLPVICSKVRGNVDLIEEGRGGYLIDPRDINEFSEKLEMLLTNDERKSYGLTNLEKIHDFDRNYVLDRMIEIYEHGE